MILSVSTSGLSQLYRQQTTDYTKTLEQIASGKRFTKPSDDFASFMKMRAAESSVVTYQRVNDELISAKEKSTIATSIGNEAYKALSDFKKMVENGADSDALDAQLEQIQKIFTNNKQVGNDIIEKASVTLGDGTSTLEFDVSGIITQLSALDNTSSATDVEDALGEVAKYTATAEAFTVAADRQLTINENIIAAKESTAANIGAIDEVQSISKATALAVRQQATIAMAAQANISQSNLARLFS
ncbi:MAG: hypothetical protein LBH98_05820 [Chitinispirillales bacterium]|jgi:hypothetical protein|nr:hypothetical protein [Chitinispirillales bacterium]